jgi:hypothetical protein
LYQLGGRWNQFIKDNMLRQGDICLFELLKENEPQLIGVGMNPVIMLL